MTPLVAVSHHLSLENLIVDASEGRGGFTSNQVHSYSPRCLFQVSSCYVAGSHLGPVYSYLRRCEIPSGRNKTLHGLLVQFGPTALDKILPAMIAARGMRPETNLPVHGQGP